MATGQEKLNSEQLKAVQIKDGPALVVAGAGTGKTRVIVERIARLIDGGAKPESILALTFTEKAAAEMVDRVNELRGGFGLDLNIYTYNAFGEQVLKRFAADIGLHRRLKLMGETAKLVFLREHLQQLKLDYYAPATRPDGLLEDIAKYFSLLKQHLVTPESYQAFIAKLPLKTAEDKLEHARHRELAAAFGAYLELSKQQAVIDYDDQIYLTLELLATRPNVANKLRGEYQYILVDEFQDTNPMQSKLLDELALDHDNIMAVGDDDQSIFAFRGATVENILGFKQRYPKAAEVVLTKNYRSGQQILDSAYRLIGHNNPHRLEDQLGISKRLSAKQAGQPVELRPFTGRSDEFAWVAADIKRRIGDGAEPGSIAVLARRQAAAAMVHNALAQAGVDHSLGGQTYDLYQAPSVSALIDTLISVVDPFDDKALFHCLIGPVFSAEPHELSRLAAASRRQHRRLYETIGEEGNPELSTYLEMIERWRTRSAQRSVAGLALDIINDSGWKQRLDASVDSDPLAEKAYIDLSKFFEVLAEFERIAQRTSASAFVDNLETLREAGRDVEDEFAGAISDELVNVMTIHKAKGLEWPTVYIVDAVEGSFPMADRSVSLALPPELSAVPVREGEHLREERRLMYVALTRAKRTAVITYSAGASGRYRRKPSRFIAELADQEPPLAAGDSPAKKLEDFEQPDLPMKRLPSSLLKKGVLHMSVSQLQDYFRCPYDFYYRHILNVPTELQPTLMYGSLIHEAIETYQRARVDGRQAGLEQLIDQLEADWPGVGWQTPGQSQQLLKTAKSTLRSFVASEEAAKRPPSAVEKDWHIRLDEAKTVVSGRFDVVYEETDGAEIRDYKTGEGADTAEKAKARAGRSDQLTLYALAWQNMSGEIPKLLSLQFVDTGQLGTIKKQPASLKTMQAKIEQAAAAIRNFDFPYGREHDYCRHPQPSSD